MTSHSSSDTPPTKSASNSKDGSKANSKNGSGRASRLGTNNATTGLESTLLHQHSPQQQSSMNSSTGGLEARNEDAPLSETVGDFLQVDPAAAYEAAAAVTYSNTELGILADRRMLTQDRLTVTRSGPGFIQSGLSCFGPLLALRRESEAGASAALGERGSDIWIGITSGGYIVLWTAGGGIETGPAPTTTTASSNTTANTTAATGATAGAAGGAGAAAGSSAAAASSSSHTTLPPDAQLLDFERFLSEQYARITLACFLHPRIAASTASKKNQIHLFVHTEEGHGLTYLLDIGIVLDEPQSIKTQLLSTVTAAGGGEATQATMQAAASRAASLVSGGALDASGATPSKVSTNAAAMAAASVLKHASSAASSMNSSDSPTKQPSSAATSRPSTSSSSSTKLARASSLSTKRIGILGIRRLVLKKAMYQREYFASTTTNSAPSRPALVTYHPVSNCILLTLDCELYAYNEQTLHTVWVANVATAILGGAAHAASLAAQAQVAANKEAAEKEKERVGGGSLTSAAAAAAAAAAASANTPEALRAAEERKSLLAAAASAPSIRLDPKQKRAHAITALVFPSLLNTDPASLTQAVANAASNAASTTGLSVSTLSPAHIGGGSSGGGFTQTTPPFFIVGTKSGYVLRIDIRRKELSSAVGVVKPQAVVQALARFNEHALLYAGLNEADLERDVTAEQRDELARKKEEERRKKIEPGVSNTNNPTAAASPVSAAANAAKHHHQAAQKHPSGGPNSTTSATGINGGSNTISTGGDGGSGGGSSNTEVAFDLGELPLSPLLICSPYFDPITGGISIKPTQYCTSITSLALSHRRGEWIIAVGGMDGFIHVISRDSRKAYVASIGVAADRPMHHTRFMDSKYARFLNPHPIQFDSSFPASLLYTLADPSPHATSVRMPPVLRLTSSHDGSCLISLDGAGTLRRWDLDNRSLSGVTHTEGIVESPWNSNVTAQAAHTQTLLQSSSLKSLKGDSVYGFSALPSAVTGMPSPVFLELIYPSAQTEQAILYGPGGLLAPQSLSSPQLSRSGSFSVPDGGTATPNVPPSPTASSEATTPTASAKPSMSLSATTVITSSMLLLANPPVPSHLLVLSVNSCCFSLWRSQRIPRASKHMGGSLIAELNEYIHTYQIEERKASESLGNSQGEKLRKEKAAVEAREAARRKRGSNISNSQMAAMMSQGYDPKTTPKTRGRKINADSASSADTSAFSSPAYDGIDSPRSRLQSPDQQQRSTAETPRAGTHHPTVQDFYGFDTSDVADIEAQLAQPVMTQDISGAIDTTASDLQLTPRSAALLDSVLAGEALTTASGKVVAPAITVVSSERPPVPPSSSVEVKDGSDISSDEEDNNEGHDAAMESKNGSNAQHPDMGAGEITLRFPEREDTPTSEASASGSGSASEPEGSDIDESAADAPATSGEEDAQEEAEAEEDEEKKQSASEEEEAEQEPASPLSSEKNVDGVVNESFDVKPIAVPIEDGNIDVNAEETEA